jgi:hypothetical protein
MNVGIILICILALSIVTFTPQAFAQSENLLYGSSSFENVPPSIIPGKPTTFDIKFQYTTGPYAISNFSPVIDVNPDSATSKVRIELQSLESLTQRQIARIPVTITVDPSIEHEKIFLSVFFTGQHFISDESYKSAWTDSVTLEISLQDKITIPLGKCETIDIEYTISGGDVFTICKSQETISVKAIVKADSEGSVTFDIPEYVLISLTSTDCDTENDFMVIMDGEKIPSSISNTQSGNLVTVDFTEGIHEIEIIGFTILPNPVPAQYCGIVEGYDKKFLPPLDQIDNGVKPEFIRCNDDLVLVQKIDDTPACVKPETKEKLIERGWAIPEPIDKNSHTEVSIEEIFMEKPLSYWKSLNFDQLREYNSQSEGDDFYYELGRLIAKEFFQNELTRQGITITNEELIVHTGWANLPDPPIIGYNTVVNATDGSTYVMHTSVQGNRVGEYFEIQEVVFEPHIIQAIADGKPAKFVNKFGESPTIYVVTEDGDDKLSKHQAIIDFNQTNSVKFVNNSPDTIRIQEVSENKIEDIPKDSWRTKAIPPGEEITLQFNSTGYYEFNVKKITDSIPGYFEHHASGEIVVFRENMTDYTFSEGLLMGRVFIQDAPRQEIPWAGLGAGNNRGLEIGIVNSMKEAIPNANEYYLAKAKSLIPFDVKVIIE